MKQNIIAKELDAELMLYEADRDEVHVLNPTAKIVYKLAEQGKTLQEIEQEIRGTFRLSADQNVLGDIQQCLQEMKEKGLTEVEK